MIAIHCVVASIALEYLQITRHSAHVTHDLCLTGQANRLVSRSVENKASDKRRVRYGGHVYKVVRKLSDYGCFVAAPLA